MRRSRQLWDWCTCRHQILTCLRDARNCGISRYNHRERLSVDHTHIRLPLPLLITACAVNTCILCVQPKHWSYYLTTQCTDCIYFAAGACQLSGKWNRRPRILLLYTETHGHLWSEGNITLCVSLSLLLNLILTAWYWSCFVQPF